MRKARQYADRPPRRCRYVLTQAKYHWSTTCTLTAVAWWCSWLQLCRCYLMALRAPNKVVLTYLCHTHFSPLFVPYLDSLNSSLSDFPHFDTPLPPGGGKKPPGQPQSINMTCNLTINRISSMTRNGTSSVYSLIACQTLAKEQ